MFVVPERRTSITQFAAKVWKTCRQKNIYNVLVYADDVNLLGDNIDTLKKNTRNLIDASKEDGLEVKIKTN
jgi:hypothetical protein